MERLFTTQEVLESWNKSCKVNDDVDQQAKDIVREALELKIAEEQGLLIRLPCKVGDTVFVIDCIYECDHYLDCPLPFEKYKCDDDIHCENECKKYRVRETVFNRSMIDRIGKTVLLTKEEAEQKLAESIGEKRC